MPYGLASYNDTDITAVISDR